MIDQLFLAGSRVTLARPRPRPYTVKLLVSCLRNPSRFFAHSHNLFRQRGKKLSFSPSHEQQEVVKLCSLKNVVVQARPGSGKTATAEAIVAANPDKRVAILTYSKRLQLETYRRLRTYSNCDVFTFHAMAGSLFGATIYNDAKLSEQRRQVLRCNELPQWSSAPFDIIVLDEFQDCTDLIFWLTNCFILANEQKTGKSPRLVVLGDERQSIYRFRGADHRYLTLAPELLRPINPYPFVRTPLSQSFRLSDQTVRFINHTFLGGESCITSSKPGPKPIVIRCNTRHDCYALAKKLSTLIKQHGAKNTAIIAPSVRNWALKRLINVLSKKHHVPIAVPIDDEIPLDETVVYGKLCVSTIHQFKGSERDLIILFDIDSSFFSYLGRDLPDDSCPNEIFVALTRAGKQLVLVHNEAEKLMPFVSVEALYETAEVVNMTSSQARITPPDTPGRPLELGLKLPRSNGVRDATRHIRGESLHEIVKRDLYTQQLSPPLPEKEHIDIPSVVPTDLRRGFHEAVSDINGLVVVAAFEHDIFGTLNTLGGDQSIIDLRLPVCPLQRVSQLCRYACEHAARLSGYQPRVIQMKNHGFDWIKPGDLALARSRLQEELRDLVLNLRFEVEAEQDFSIDNQKTRLQGRADIVAISSSDCEDNENVESIWEIKFVSQLSNEHIVQACMYTYLFAPQAGELPRTILYNVRDGEKWEITPHDGREGLRRMIESVLRLRHTTAGEMKHEEFIDMCAKTTLETLNLDDS
ncbi:P-loop containing nucleoside triphosphate hydrolase protein [Xylogone sp. PMI_703]|nr:P-loop containing nucleoside triphosphate hydrolase protein [Xylogone sp. PMI_703]